MPTTEAGKRLLASNWTSLPMSDDFFDMNEAIDAIEDEARADNAEEIAAGAVLADRARIRAAVEGLRDGADDHGWLTAVAAVLRIIDGEGDDAAG